MVQHEDIALDKTEILTQKSLLLSTAMCDAEARDKYESSYSLNEPGHGPHCNSFRISESDSKARANVFLKNAQRHGAKLQDHLVELLQVESVAQLSGRPR